MANMDQRINVGSRRSRGWFWMDNGIVDGYGAVLGPFGLAAYTALVRHANAESWVVSLNRLAKETGMGRTTIQAAVEKLERLDMIEVVERRSADGQHSSAYFILDAPETPRADWKTRPRPVRVVEEVEPATPIARRRGGSASRRGPHRQATGPPSPGDDVKTNSSKQTSTEESSKPNEFLELKPLAEKVLAHARANRITRWRDLIEHEVVSAEEVERLRANSMCRATLRALGLK